MFSKEEAKNILLEAVKTGADFADLFVEHTRNSSVVVQANKVKSIDTSCLSGAGLRLLRGMEEVYAYTNDVSYEGILKMAKELREFFNYDLVVKDVSFTDTLVGDFIKLNKEDIDIKRVCKNLRHMNKVMLDYDKEIIQASSSYQEHQQVVEIYNTNGVYKTDLRNQSRYFAVANSQNETGMEVGVANFGGSYNESFYKDYDFTSLAKDAAKQAITVLHAPQIKGGVYDVVIHNSFGGVIFHEACGHALEASSVARGLSVFSNKLGEKIASDCVTAIDDGTIQNEWGSINIDDEGTIGKKNVLIENGVLKSYMVDFKNSRIMNHPVTGSSRRQSYKYVTTSRMTNTFIENGKHSFEDLIKATKYGLFAKSLGGGQVNPATGDFNFSVNEGYLIEDGKITTPVRGATLIGKGNEVLFKIDMVANNRTLGYGVCGASSGSIHACVGQPTIRVKDMTVGGNGGE